MRIFVLLLLCTRLLSQQYNFQYNLREPLKQMALPPVLHEISGITHIDSVTIACVQDEKGYIFFFDLARQEIVRELQVAPDGDYEAVARVGNSLFMLRSDGSLFEVPDYKKAPDQTRLHLNQVPSTDNEGLCYDPYRKRLLLSSKGMVEGEDRRIRPVYALDEKSMKLAQKPAYRFDVETLTESAVERKLREPYRITPKGKAVPSYLKFHMSEIALHPHTGELFVLSANDYMLFVFERNGRLRHIEKLPPEIFNKAEGLTFLDNGDLIITNEGESGQPTLLWFRKSSDSKRG